MPIAPLFVFTPPTPPNMPNGCGGKSKTDLAGGVWVFGVFALAFCVLELREEKKPRRNTEQGGGLGLGRKVGFACAWIAGGLRVDCNTPEHPAWQREEKQTRPCGRCVGVRCFCLGFLCVGIAGGKKAKAKHRAGRRAWPRAQGRVCLCVDCGWIAGGLREGIAGGTAQQVQMTHNRVVLMLNCSQFTKLDIRRIMCHLYLLGCEGWIVRGLRVDCVWIAGG